MLLKDRVAIITGGGRGIGRGTALRLAREGAKLALVDIEQSHLDETAAELDAAGAGKERILLQGDVSSSADVQRFFDETVKRFGRLDILVNNAGIGNPPVPIVDMPEDHVFFRAHYTIDEDLMQVPGYGGGVYGRGTSQRDGYDPILKAIFDDEGRIMVIVFGNTDLGDALEWAEDPMYPLRYSTYASELFLNSIMYAMTY